MYHRNGWIHNMYVFLALKPLFITIWPLPKCFTLIYYLTFLLYIFFLYFAAITNPKLLPNIKDATKSFNFDYSYWSQNVITKILFITICIIIFIILYFSHQIQTLHPKLWFIETLAKKCYNMLLKVL